MKSISQLSLVPNRSRWSFQLAGWWYVLLIAFVAAVLAFTLFQPLKVLPRIGLAPGFSFTNQLGQRVTNEDYRGRLVFYNFSYTRCGPGCPQTSSQMQALQERLSQERGLDDLSIALVTISIDPQRDTPAALRAYAGQFQMGQKSPITWEFLTGDPVRTRYVVGGGFGMYYEPEPADDKIKFEPRFVLVDGWGIIRAVYQTDRLDIERVMRDFNFLASEVRHSQGVARLAYEAAHLFQCYP